MGDQALSIKIQHAIQDLITSCWVKPPDGSGSKSGQTLRFIEVQKACNELLSLPVHSEDGRLQVTGKLTKLDGNFVVKIIRKGLSSLSKVYRDSKELEEESLKFVDLCVLQLQRIQKGSNSVHQVASPAVIVDWTMELCDELVKKKISLRPQPTNPVTNSLSKIRDLYKTIRSCSRLDVMDESNERGRKMEIITFNTIHKALKPRIHFEGFEELVEQTAAIIEREVKRTRTNTSHKYYAIVLSKWLKLLKISPVTNWFAAQVAKQDLERLWERLPICFAATYNTSLICQAADGLASFEVSVDDLFCDMKRLEIFLKFPDVLVLHIKACFRLIQSKDVGTDIIVDLLSTLKIKLKRDSFHANTHYDQWCKARKLKLIDEDSIYRPPDPLTPQKISFNAITQALLALPVKNQVLDVVRIWEQNFPNDASYHMLSELFILVSEVIQLRKESISKDMEQLCNFLSQLSNELSDTLYLWQIVLLPLMEALPKSWYQTENLSLTARHVDKMKHYQDRKQRNIHLTRVTTFLTLLTKANPYEKVKITIFQLGLDLLEDVPQDWRYEGSEFVLNIIWLLLSVLETTRVRQYAYDVLEILKKHGSSLPDSHPVINIISAIRKSCFIHRKQEVLEDFLRHLQQIVNFNGLSILCYCSGFLKYSVNTDNTIKFFALTTAEGAQHYFRFILNCMYCNQEILNDQERLNNHIDFLFKTITDEKFSSNTDLLELFTKTVVSLHRFLSYPSNEIFEVIITAIGDDIATGTYEKNVNEAAIRVLHAAVSTHQEDTSLDFHSFYVDLNIALSTTKHLEDENRRDVITEGLCLAAKLPFTLQQIKCLIENFLNILNQASITNDQEVCNVVTQLLQIPRHGLPSSLASDNLYLMFEWLLKLSTGKPPSRRQFYFTDEGIKILSEAFLLLELPIEGTNSNEVLKKEIEQDPQLSPLSQIVEDIKNKSVFEEELKNKVKEINEMLLRCPLLHVPLIGKCLRECYTTGCSEQPSIKTLTQQILENVGHWSELSIKIEWIGRMFSWISPDEALGGFLDERMTECYIAGLKEKQNSNTLISSILKGSDQRKELKTEILEIEKAVSNVSPKLIPYTPECVREYQRAHLDEETSFQSLNLRILQSFEQWKSVTTAIEKMEKELSATFPEFIPLIRECMRHCYLVGVNEKPDAKAVIPQVFESVAQWKELDTKVAESEKMASNLAQELIPLSVECMKQWYLFGLRQDGKDIQDFIFQIIEALGQFTWTGSIHKSCLDIPKHLYLIFKESKSNEEAKKSVVKMLAVVDNLDPTIHSKDFLENGLESLIQHDFYTLLCDTSLTIDDVCSILFVYKSIEDRSLLLDFAFSRKENFLNFAIDWSNVPDLTECESGDSKVEKSEFPTPGCVAHLVINQLRRLGIPDSNLKDTTARICVKLLDYARTESLRCPCMDVVAESMTSDDYLRFLFDILNKSSYLSELEYWLEEPRHHAVQCKNVITAACSWRAGSKTCKEAMRMNIKVSDTLMELLITQNSSHSRLCFKQLSVQLDLMTRILRTSEEEYFVSELFKLIFVSMTATKACLDIIPSWSKTESLLLVENLTHLYETKVLVIEPRYMGREPEVALQVLPFAARRFPNSAGETINFLKSLIQRNGGDEDKMSLGRIPVWYKQMTNAGYPPQVIQSWCTSLVHTQNLCSSDVDAITNITPETIKLLNNESDEIGRCLFSLDGAESAESFKRCLSLARLLNELSFIARELKTDLIAVRIIKEGVQELCSSFTSYPSSLGSLYKIRDLILNQLFASVFGGKNQEYLEPLKQLTAQRILRKSLIILFRRLARCIVSKPVIVSHVKKIVETILNHVAKAPTFQYQELEMVIYWEVLNFESNQDAIHILQAAGYNKSTSITEDLWYSTSIQMSALVPTATSFATSRKERTMRHNIEEQAKKSKKLTGRNLEKMVIVWENRLLEAATMCSEKIPDCYAPNGFHSEKPVICGLAIDNRILTLYKQDDGDNRTEMENVEVKLYPAGMVVFGLFCNSHPYDTEQMWAAFYKMLLDKHLVPKIFLTNVSPGFDWIKQFVEPETSPPVNTNFLSCCDLIPSSEDSFDYFPEREIPNLHQTCNPDVRDLMILTTETAKALDINSIKPPNRNTVIRQNIDTVVLHLQENDRRLREMHPDSHEKILGRLKFAIRNALVISVDGGEPTEESISSSIDMEKLLFGCQDGQQYSKEDYAAIILDAVRTVTGSLQGSNRCYDGCEHVEFL